MIKVQQDTVTLGGLEVREIGGILVHRNRMKNDDETETDNTSGLDRQVVKDIRRTRGHRSDQTLNRYIRIGDLFQHNAAGVVL